jgi:calcineurin-like phosphoesterase family protein
MAVYACSDLHGQRALFDEIKKMLNPEDTVYFLGDAADRGDDGWEMIKEIYKDSRFIYLKGNHEDMLVNAAKDYYYKDITCGYNFNLLCYNGGLKTFEDMTLDPFGKDWIEVIDKLPLIATYINAIGDEIILSHAGFTPSVDRTPYDNDLLWDREHFLDDWDDDNFFNTVIIHGHTPTAHIACNVLVNREEILNLKPGAFWYKAGCRKCGIDQGSAYTNTALLLDLDTYEEHIIQIVRENKDA